MKNIILGKALSFVVAFIVGATGVAVATSGEAAVAATTAGSFGALQDAVNAEGYDWQVAATRDGGVRGIQFRTHDTGEAHRWQVLRNGEVIAKWKSAALGWWEQGSVARTTQYDFDLKAGKRYVFTLKRDGERVYRSGVIR